MYDDECRFFIRDSWVYHFFIDNDDDDENDEAGNTGLISNLKKLYEQDGLGVDKHKYDDILQPEMPDALKKKDDFMPEVKIKGAEFWEERNNPHMQHQQQYFNMQ